jgi:hypothetical protein
MYFYPENRSNMFLKKRWYTPSTMGARVRRPSASDVDRYVILTKLFDSIFNILAVFIGEWQIQIYLHRDISSVRLPTQGMTYFGS